MLKSVSIAALILLLPFIVSPTVALGEDTVDGTATAEFVDSGEYAGLWCYTVDVTWDVDHFGAGHFDVFLDSEGIPGMCPEDLIQFPSPAGQSTGSDGGEPCTIDYEGEFLCKTDPSLPFENFGYTIKFIPHETSCETETSGSATFVFYSALAPAQSVNYPNALALKHGQEVTLGDIFGRLPGGSGEPAPARVTINEFLVKQPSQYDEFIEIYNSSPATVDLTDWQIEVGNHVVNLGGDIPPGGFGIDFEFLPGTTVELSFDLDTEGNPIQPGDLVNETYSSWGVTLEREGPGVGCGDGDELYANDQRPPLFGTQPNVVSPCAPPLTGSFSDTGEGIVHGILAFPAKKLCIDVAADGEGGQAFLQVFDAADELLGEILTTPGLDQSICIQREGIRGFRFSGRAGTDVFIDCVRVTYEDEFGPWVFAIKKGAGFITDPDDVIPNPGGCIFLFNDEGQIEDQVCYGNRGGAPISAPLLVPNGAAPGRLSADSQFRTSQTYDSLATSTQRPTDGDDTDDDAQDFNIGLETSGSANGEIRGQLGTDSRPTPGQWISAEEENGAQEPQLGSSVRVNRIYAFQPGQDGIELFNPTGGIINVANWHLSDGSVVEPIFAGESQILLEPGGRMDLRQADGRFSFELDFDDVLYLYDQNLIRLDQLGWLQIPVFFPDSCLIRVPDGAGPADGYDFDTSGGLDGTLTYDVCPLQAPNVDVPGIELIQTRLAAPYPNPSHTTATIEFSISGGTGSMVPAEVVVYDVAGRKVRTLARGSFSPGSYRYVWDTITDTGVAASAGVYFVRLRIPGRDHLESRPLVLLNR